LILFSAGTGIDWSQHDLDTPLEYLETDGSRSVLLTYTRLDPSRQWTLRQIYEKTLGQQHLIIGGPKTVADELERLADEGGVDGFNISYALLPGSFEDVIQYVIPVLRERGRIRERTPGQTLRQRLSGSASSYLPDDHPAARYRTERTQWPTSSDAGRKRIDS